MKQGQLFTGLGKGDFFINIYKEKIKEKIGFLPFPGTLNLKITDDSFLNTLPKKRIEEFFIDDKNYGAVTLYPIKLNTIEAAIIRPERTQHKKEVIEIIASFYLREKLNLIDGNTVTITFLNES